MATMKRRVIYTSDEEWEAYRAEAQATGRSVSDFIRSHLVGYLRAGMQADVERLQFTSRLREQAAEVARTIPTPPGTEARYDMRPIRPVPKHGK